MIISCKDAKTRRKLKISSLRASLRAKQSRLFKNWIASVAMLLRNDEIFYFFSPWRLCVLILFYLINSSAIAATPIILESPPINTHNRASILRGAQFFAKNCMMCHSLKYLTNDPIARAAGIDYSKMPIQSQEWWAGTPPPDLTLEVAARGSNWIYTYLHSFYQDNTRPNGNNNLLVDNTNMPNPFVGMQGIQILVIDKKELMRSRKKLHWFNALELVKQGTMAPEEFDRTTADLVNFLTYASDPAKIHREKLGWWVILYLIIFAGVAYILMRSYWKKIK